MKFTNNKICRIVLPLPVILAIAWLSAEVPGKVTVSLPVQAKVEGVVLQPGIYVMAVEEFSGEKARIKILKEGSSAPLVTAPVTAFQGPAPAPRKAIKVISREGSYYLDKLLLEGEKTGFQFRP